MEIYFVQQLNQVYTVSGRTCSYHRSIYHGMQSHPETLRHAEVPPTITNRNREPLHVRRSGRFVPKIWFGCAALIVADDVKTRLERLPNTEFLPVVFDRLTDIPMPALGDFSWYERITYPPGPEPDYELETKPDVPEFHSSIGRYWEILSVNRHELDSQPLDWCQVEINFGSYSGALSEDVLVSVSLLREYPFVWSDAFQIREDAFAIIAPYLDLDYFAIARHWIDTDDDPNTDEHDYGDDDDDDA